MVLILLLSNISDDDVVCQYLVFGDINAAIYFFACTPKFENIVCISMTLHVQNKYKIIPKALRKPSKEIIQVMRNLLILGKDNVEGVSTIGEW